ncbi:O-methyltransferase-domain-containing protein [Aspergillus falconensis]
MGTETEYLQSIQQALKSLTTAANNCQLTYTHAVGQDVHSLCAREAVRKTLVLEANKFLQIAQGPVDAAATCFEQTAHLASVRALLEAGVFEVLPTDGTPRTMKEVADKLDVDESLLARLMRHASLYGPLEETGPASYRHTPFSLVYLRPEIRGMVRFAMDEHMPAHLKLHEYLQQTSWTAPSSSTNNPYTHAHGITGTSMFANLSAPSNKHRLDAFNDAMTVQATTAIWMIDLFPFHEVLSPSASADTVLAVDIGGGTGRAISRIRSLAGNLPGRYILQDQAHVVSNLPSSYPSSYLDGIETMAHDFFTLQPVAGAQIYLIRRCLHNWPEESVIRILKNIAPAMDRTNSRLLIEEIIVPESNSGIEEGWMDMIMMTLGAKQRTLEEWRGVLGTAGMEVVRVYRVDGICHGLIEARVKRE